MRLSARATRAVRAALAALTLTGASLVLSAAPAGAATAVWEGYGSAQDIDTVVGAGSWDGVEAGIMRLRIGDRVYAGYCIEFFNDRLESGATYVDTPWTSVAAATAMPRVNWILRNGYPLVSTTTLAGIIGQEISADQAAAATQAAIWAYTEPGFGLAPSNDAPVLALFAYLTGSANVGVPEEAMGTGVGVTPATLTGEAGTRIGPFTVTGTATPASVTVDAPGAITDAAGNPVTSVAAGGTFYVDVPVDTPVGALTITVSGTSRIPTGRVFFTPDRDPALQPQVLADPATEPASAVASVCPCPAVGTTTTRVVVPTVVGTTTTRPTSVIPSSSSSLAPLVGTTTTVPTTPFSATSSSSSTTRPPTPPTSTFTTVTLDTIQSTLPVGGGGEEYRGTLLVTLALLLGGGVLVGIEVLAAETDRRRRRGSD